MSILEVPGARLHYETQGSGPPLLLIPGANGDARVFGAVAGHLSRRPYSAPVPGESSLWSCSPAIWTSSACVSRTSLPR
jgi:pimeloyl-ACP methyl ester carboxylesterase